MSDWVTLSHNKTKTLHLCLQPFDYVCIIVNLYSRTKNKTYTARAKSKLI
jgi:hypothetical protein